MAIACPFHSLFSHENGNENYSNLEKDGQARFGKIIDLFRAYNSQKSYQTYHTCFPPKTPTPKWSHQAVDQGEIPMFHALIHRIYWLHKKLLHCNPPFFTDMEMKNLNEGTHVFPHTFETSYWSKLER